MNEAEFLSAYREQKPLLEAWAEHIRLRLLREFPASMFKIPVTFRLKDDESIVMKAFHRNKGYTDPLIQITDKVGLRVVVLLEEEVGRIGDFIQGHADWSWSKDRNFEEERRAKPLVFDYQSDHFVLRPKPVSGFDESLSCELQIRTLLQHAYAELTHDLIYKAETPASKDAFRFAARGMALVETAGGVFTQVSREAQRSNAQNNDLIDLGRAVLESWGVSVVTFDRNFCLFLLEEMKGLADAMSHDDLRAAIEGLPGPTKKRHAERAAGNMLYRQPVSPLIYPWIQASPNRVCELWPLTDGELRPFFTQLGVQMPGSV